ncbi:glycerol-3-phosphate 1-O-acyltransferase PlsY [Desemzia sp. RIT804]|uniref:glycerol-3-phosphate 1-O-acyltransferase PlsY n=1 Tax=Desemzia sp. RIT 804 TaxID=2810209 RepID=UPI001950570A|nr:glycerol-3-phosphate 1-O-acyltransferase PlsY [Desemzia sp. RIT 804]MBM6613767.1 glycerol-3-phosphate 1-O-acyltransferase PlsY [Desemzia sp. RIT 804]
MTTILMFVLSYLLGSIPSGVWIGKKFYNTDIREYGSGNTGTTNTFRVLGVKAGIAVLAADVLKGTLGASLPYFFNSDLNPMVVGLGAILGHTYPLFAHFKGGKAVATSAGVLLAYNPPFFIYCILVFGVLLYFTRMVSLSSMTALVLITISTLFIQDWVLTIIAFILTIFITYRHRDNITRIKNGTESKVPFGFRYKKE